jgi:hypothetical protein
MLVKEEKSLACRWLLTWASVRSFTFISSNADFGVAPRRCNKKQSKEVSEPRICTCMEEPNNRVNSQLAQNHVLIAK